MAEVRRVQSEPAWLLHHRPFRDTSRILELMTRDHGRLSLVARGSRAAKSRLAGILRPFMPLSISWFSRSELGTLTGAEVAGRPIALDGDALLSGYYLNELLLNLTHRFDAQPEIFDLYAMTVQRLGAGDEIAPVLRRFEIELLGLLGYALTLDRVNQTDDEIVPGHYYDYQPAHGPVPVAGRDGAMIFTGADLLAIGRLQFEQRAVQESANRLLRGVIAYHLDGKELKSRKVLREIRKASTLRED